MMYLLLMRSFSFLAVGCALSMIMAGCDSNSEEEPTTGLNQEDIQRLSETMGHIMVENLNAQHLKMDIAALIRGIEQAQSGEMPPLGKKEFFKLLTRYRQSVFSVQSAENLKIAEDFLKDNQYLEGVVVVEKDRLEYLVLDEGSGDKVAESGTPLIHYEGRLLSGQIFDSTAKRGKPAPLSLKTTIPGFRRGVSGMHTGEKRRLFIHPEMGYGTKGRLPPNSLLIFDIEVVKADTGYGINPSAPLPLQNQETAETVPAPASEGDIGWVQKLKQIIF